MEMPPEKKPGRPEIPEPPNPLHSPEPDPERQPKIPPRPTDLGFGVTWS